MLLGLDDSKQDPGPAAIEGTTADLEEALDELGEALAGLTAARDRVEERRQAVHVHLRRLGAYHLAEGTKPPHELIRRLYWDYPEVSADEIARALNCTTTEVRVFAGAGVQRAPCLDCGEVELERHVASRSAARQHGGYYGRGSRDWRLCDSCRATRREEEQRRHEERQREFAEEERLRQQALREGRYRISRIIEFEGVGGTMFLPDDHEEPRPSG